MGAKNKINTMGAALLLLTACATPGETPGASPADTVSATNDGSERDDAARADAPEMSGAAAIGGDAELSSEPILSPEITQFAEEIAPRLQDARYMEGQCTDGAFPGWEGLPLIDCAYSVKNADETTRDARVIMLNPDAVQLARWVFSACEAILDPSAECRERVFNATLKASGGQFPVAGIVYEDIIPGDGAFETYAFRNGVTVRLAGLGHRLVRPLTENEKAISVDPEASVERVFRYARIMSTTREQYQVYAPDAAPGDDQRWDMFAGEIYRNAWGQSALPLMNARAGIKDGLFRVADGESEPAWFTKPQLEARNMLCIRYNNYWCIKSAGWNGEIGTDERNHAIFSEAAFGARAFFRLMRNYRVRHNLRSTKEIFNRYAPSTDCIGSVPRDPVTGECPNGENPTIAYAKRVAESLGVGFEDDIQLFDGEGRIRRSVALPLARAVLQFELGPRYAPSDALLDDGLERAGLTVIP